MKIDSSTELPAALLSLNDAKFEVVTEGTLTSDAIDQHFHSEAVLLYQDGRALLLYLGKDLGNVTRKDAVKHAVYYLRDKGIERSVQLSMMYESEKGMEILKQRYSIPA